jgi:hypothetical protein
VPFESQLPVLHFVQTDGKLFAVNATRFCDPISKVSWYKTTISKRPQLQTNSVACSEEAERFLRMF